MSSLAVDIREKTGKGVARKLRREGRIPAVMYGQGREPVALALDPRPLLRLLEKEGRNTLIDLDGGLSGRTVLVRDIQIDPVKRTPLHADFLEIKQDVTLEVSVPVHLIGEPVGVTLEGGVLDHSLRELELECLPRNIPDSIDVDVTGLHIGDSIHVADLSLPPGVEVRIDEDVTVVSVMAPSVEEEAAAPVEAEAAEGAEEAPSEAEEGESKD